MGYDGMALYYSYETCGKDSRHWSSVCETASNESVCTNLVNESCAWDATNGQTCKGQEIVTNCPVKWKKERCMCLETGHEEFVDSHYTPYFEAAAKRGEKCIEDNMFGKWCAVSPKCEDGWRSIAA